MYSYVYIKASKLFSGKRKVNIHYNIIKVIKVTVYLNYLNKLKYYCKPAAMTERYCK